MRILIVDDEPVNRLVLARKLTGWGHEVVQASDGAQAWDIMQREPFRMVITDWMMPEMDGVELTRRIRQSPAGGYTYVLLLTASSGTAALVEGMDAGADDFMVKPFQAEELRARLRAGERVLQLESDLAEHNRRLIEANATARRDLEAAAEMQQALLPAAGLDLGTIRPAWKFLPASFVAGDVFNVHAVDERFSTFYLLDVAGHGVPSAMLSFTLSKLLSPSLAPDGLVKRAVADDRGWELTPPAEVLRELNERFQDDSDALKYFTMIYGVVDAERNVVRLAQAGHPTPLLQRGTELVRTGDSGFPVGMLPGLDYEEAEFAFAPGDRLFLYSDGVTECAGAAREQFKLERLEECVRAGRDGSLQAVVEDIEARLRRWRGEGGFEDDVTLLALERRAA
ncbi:MAG: fused response regulator/phosphatase [Candidatus Eisenbacteria bacterium]|nr:fused response regulator/phosphatase [Candidatus Eisenbacteria bacterium]